MDLQVFLSSLTTFTIVNKDFIKDYNLLITIVVVGIIVYNNYKEMFKLFKFHKKYTYSLSVIYIPWDMRTIQNKEMLAVCKTIINKKNLENIEIKSLTDILSFPYTKGVGIKIDNNLEFSSLYEDRSSSGSSMYELTIILKSDDMSFIKNFIKVAVEETSLSILKRPKIFFCTGVDKNDCVIFNCIDFLSTKSFDNIFFTGKEEMQKKIKKFESSKDEYQRLGIPYNFGMLFHGKPGTAKTSCCKAIARFTNRHIVSVSLSKIKNIKQLSNIFLSDTLAGIKIPTDKRLYIFDEADCNLFSKRNDDTNKENNMEKLLEKVIKKDDESEDCSGKIPIGEVLELLDGIVETSGRIMIFITNHPEKMDPAMVRPGRIDENIEFKCMNSQDIDNMYYLWFGQRLDQELLLKINNEKYTLADIGKLFRSYDNTEIKNILSSSKNII